MSTDWGQLNNPTPPFGTSVAEGWGGGTKVVTKDELLKEAKFHKIVGRHAMTKKAIALALTEAKAKLFDRAREGDRRRS